MNASKYVVFPLIPFILLLICAFCTVTLYLGFRNNKKELFGRVINAFLIYMFVHAFYVWIVECFFPNQSWLVKMFPFILLYGPFYYFAIKTSIGEYPSIGKIILHSIPFFCFFLVFMIYVFEGWYIDHSKYQLFKGYLSKVALISLSGYCLYGFMNGKGSFTGKLNDKRTIVFLGGIVLLFFTMFLFSVFISKSIVFENVEAMYLFRLMVYCCMLVITLLVFVYQTAPLLNQRSSDIAGTSLEPSQIKEPLPRYEKSVLSESQLDHYEMILNELMENKSPFLNHELSLSELAFELKVPSHHLTQLLNTRLQITFHNYINHLRVLHACKLMETSSVIEMTLEEVGSLSGFNSKVSFNRHFKLWMRCTPSEYRKGLK